MIIAILAMTKEFVIGNDNRLPWHIPEDLKYFKENTLNKTIVMGRKTYESIGKALPKRTNIVITRDDSLKLPDAQVISNYKDLIARYENNVNEDVYIIGGSEIFNLFLKHIDIFYINWIKKNYPGNVKFNSINFNNYMETKSVEHSEFIAKIYHKK